MADTDNNSPDRVPDKVELAAGDATHISGDSDKQHTEDERSERSDRSTKDCCDCRGPCVYPQGKKATRSVLLAILACVFSIAGVGGCNFLTVDGDAWGLLWRQEHFIEGGNVTDRKLHCTAWSTYEKDLMDGEYKTGRAFAFFTIIILILSVSPVLALSCATIDRASLRLLAACFLLATFFQCLVFVAFASEVCQVEAHCKISFEGGLTLAGMVFCLMTAFSLLRMKNMSNIPKQERTPTGEDDAANGNEGEKQDLEGKRDDSSTHAIDEDDQHEAHEEEYETPMQQIGEATEEEEADTGASDTAVDAGDSEEHPSQEQGHWWSRGLGSG